MPRKQTWDWQQPDWPDFRYDSSQLATLEADFLRQSGIFTGALGHVEGDDQTQLTIELISDEALCTSEIEGEMLNRDSLQSSIRHQFGLATDNRKIPPAEQGISQMMVELKPSSTTDCVANSTHGRTRYSPAFSARAQAALQAD